MPFMLQPVTAQKILDLWARKPLDFDPGTKWQYSNTNYVIAGVIAEKAARKPLLQFLREKVFVPLQMKSVTDIDQEKLDQSDPTRLHALRARPAASRTQRGQGLALRRRRAGDDRRRPSQVGHRHHQSKTAEAFVLSATRY
jgi:CubicO group peptidase (beta-lactamase class C family)